MRKGHRWFDRNRFEVLWTMFAALGGLVFGAYVGLGVRGSLAGMAIGATCGAMPCLPWKKFRAALRTSSRRPLVVRR
jgi:hypothetical protein